MSHVRKLIRDDVVTTLTGLATTGTNIYRSRVYPLAANKLPGITIYTKSDASEYATNVRPRTILRTLTVVVEAYVQALSDYDSQLDTIAVEIEEALAADVTRGGYAKDTRIVAFDAEYSGDGDLPVASAVFTIEVLYSTLENDAETAK
jgi:hypothetical protein